MKRVLIVDDDPAVRELLSFILSARGMECETAADGEQAIARLGQQVYDTVVLDLVMPRIDGTGVIAHMREHGIETPVVVLAAARDEVAPDDAIVRVTMRKPLVPDALKVVVDTLCSSAEAAAPA
jgi:DNA-binding response OmpR family regulator